MEQARYQPKGMRQDESFLNFNKNYALENKNIRISTTGLNSKYSLTNERGNKKCTLNYVDIDPSKNEQNITLEGTVIGEAKVGKYWVIFTTGTLDKIYRLEQTDEDTFEVRLLIEDNLNFDVKHPLETVSYVETDDIQKVYWVDGKNQTRLINIVDKDVVSRNFNVRNLDFVTPIELKEEVEIIKFAGGALRSPGTVQYVCTYINIFNQESNPFYISPLYYLSSDGKGVSEEDSAACYFNIRIKYLDQNYNYCRVYSITKTSNYAQPIVKLVAEVPFNRVSYYNYNLVGSKITSGTLAQTYWELKRGYIDSWNYSSGQIGPIQPSDDAVLETVLLDGYTPLQILENRNIDNYPPVKIYLDNEYFNSVHIKTLVDGSKQLVYTKYEAFEYNQEEGESPAIFQDQFYASITNDYTINFEQLDDSNPIKQKSSIIEAILNNFYDIADSINQLDSTTTLFDFVYPCCGIDTYVITNDNYEDITKNITSIQMYFDRNVEGEFTSAQNLLAYSSSGLGPWPRCYRQLGVVTNSDNNRMIEEFIDRFPIYTNAVNKLPWDLIGLNGYPKDDFLTEQSWLETEKFVDVLHIEHNNKIYPIYISKASRFKNRYFKSLKYKNQDINEEIVLTPINEQESLESPGSIVKPITLEHNFDGESTSNRTTLIYLDDPSKHQFGAYTGHESYDQIVVVDNDLGELVDATHPLYVGGYPIIPYTISHKDNTLFIGNIQQELSDLPETIKKGFKSLNITTSRDPELEMYLSYKFTDDYKSQYRNTNKHFKAGETYRYGVILQHNTGVWSQPIWIEDYKNLISPWNNYDSKNNNYSSDCINFAIPFSIINKDLIKEIIQLGYTKIKPVAVFPTDVNREIICQGIILPTVYNRKWRQDKTTYAQLAWDVFFGDITNLPHHSTITYENQNLIQYDYKNIVEDIKQGTLKAGISNVGDKLTYPINKSTIYDDSVFHIDRNIITFHSPDIEFNESISNYGSSLKLHIFQDCQFEEPHNNMLLISGSPNPNKNGIINDDQGEHTQEKHWTWKDYPYSLDNKINYDWYNILSDFRIYRWQGSGPLNNSHNQNNKSAVLERKVMATVRYVKSTMVTHYQDYNYDKMYSRFPYQPKDLDPLTGDSIQYNYYNLKDISFYNQGDSVKMLDSTFGTIVYQGTVNNIVSNGWSTGYPVTDESLSSWVNHKDEKSKREDIFRSNPVNMTYKGTPHAVMQLDHSDNTRQMILPWGTDNYTKKDQKVFYDNSIKGYDYRSPGYDHTTNPGSIYIGELVRIVPDKFGGDYEYALTNNTWNIAGESTRLDTLLHMDTPVIKWTDGDTYYQRYDCLLCQPYNEQDVNQVVTIISFPIETYINLYGRYDDNEGLENAIYITDNNFNKVNLGYTQHSNYFSYFILPETQSKRKYFPQQFTWTKTKRPGATVDTWANITLASTMDLNGDLGPLRAIRNYNGNLIAFQDRGIALIKYNSNVALETAQGVPVELANSGKVDGTQYISNNVGCKNKWSIAFLKDQLYFIDSANKDLYTFSDKGVVSISQAAGMESWSSANIDDNIWDLSEDNKSIKVLNDNLNNELLLTSKDFCLAFNQSQDIEAFTSFYDYQGTSFMQQLEGNTYTIKDGNIWRHNAGNYNEFYGEVKPFWTKILVNDKPFQDKIFDVLEFRSDSYRYEDNEWKLVSDTFTDLIVENEYQLGSKKLDTKSLKRKFRIWRTHIPRDTKNNQKGRIKDRMRNTWLKLTLKGDPSESTKYNKTVLHDLTVHYT